MGIKDLVLAELVDALNHEEVQELLNSNKYRQASVIQHEIHDLIYYWFKRNIDKKDLDKLKLRYPYLEAFLDFDVLEERLLLSPKIEEIVRTDEDKQRKIPFRGLHIDEFIPELNTLRASCWELLDTVEDITEKAELWLYPYAIQPSVDGSIEASIYFASRGNPVHDLGLIKDCWCRAICSYFAMERWFLEITPSEKEKAKEKKLSLAEIAGIIERSECGYQRFFSFRDDEEDFIDYSFLRAVEWLEIRGFEKWVDELANDADSWLAEGHRPESLGWSLFFGTRSDIFLRKCNKFTLEALLHSLAHGSYDKSFPWENKDINRGVDSAIVGWRHYSYIPLASAISFTWRRVQPSNLSSDIADSAENLLFQCQLSSGAWPIRSDETKGDILSTCLAVHAIASSNQKGWQEVAQKAAIWLEKQQQETGCWAMSWGSIVMLTVLVLDTLNLARRSNVITYNKFASNRSQSILKEKILNDDYAKEPWYTMQEFPIATKSKQDIVSNIDIHVAIVVAVEVELKQALKHLKPLPGKRKLWRVYDAKETLYIGKFGAFNAVLMMTAMGSQGPAGSALAINYLISGYRPKALFLVGIAFGIDSKKQEIADVLISDKLVPYESVRKSADKKDIFRNPIPSASQTLINRARHALNWSFARPDGFIVRKQIGAILSGEKLIDSKSFKEDVLEIAPTAIGGEMEGAGLWACADREKIDWIVIKAICDWADGEKNKKYQPLAAASAMSFCEHLLTEKELLSGIL